LSGCHRRDNHGTGGDNCAIADMNALADHGSSPDMNAPAQGHVPAQQRADGNVAMIPDHSIVIDDGSIVHENIGP